jgi:hypothetical protein
MGTKPNAEHIPEIETALAVALYKALEQSNPSGFLQGEPNRAIIDGTFNLEAVAKQVLWDLRHHLMLS